MCSKNCTYSSDKICEGDFTIINEFIIILKFYFKSTSGNSKTGGFFVKQMLEKII